MRRARLGNGLRRSAWSALMLLPALAGAASHHFISPQDPEFRAGLRIYRDGQLSDGGKLRGESAAAGVVGGATAACGNCHGRSGMGSSEGTLTIPPITGAHLLRAVAPSSDGAASAAHLPPRAPYTDYTLARAIREGIDPNGRTLNDLMPRFALDDLRMGSLIAYLKGLSRQRIPGVTGDDTLEFATVITPDADPVRREGVLQVLSGMFDLDDPGHVASGRRALWRSVGRAAGRRWLLHVWPLKGEPDTWDTQLDQYMRAQPVLALISGVGGRDWTPVHRYCERAAVPCLMPIVDLPVVAEGDFYPLYFNGGVLLEGQLLAQRLMTRSPAPQRVVQVFRAGDVGEDGARALAATLAGKKIALVNRSLAEHASARTVAEALTAAGAGDALVLWLRPADLSGLPARPPTGALPFASGLMAGLERAPIPVGWRAPTELTYPFELPQLRSTRMNFPLGWFHIHEIPVVDERAQTDAYLTCLILADALTRMHGEFSRDYLVEQVEAHLDHRLVNGYYPRLGLAPGQRLASKGGYIVRFPEPSGTKFEAVTAWMVPGH